MPPYYFCVGGMPPYYFCVGVLAPTAPYSAAYAQLTIHLCMYVYEQFEFIFIAFVTLVNACFDKIITTDSPKSQNPAKSVHLYKYCQLCWQFLSIMLALCSLLLLSYMLKLIITLV